MFNEYIEKLNTENEWTDLSRGQKDLVSAYLVSTRNGYECMAVFESFNADEAGDFYSELKAAGINELFYGSETSNYLDAFLAFQKAGAKMVGMVELENPKYKRDIERWGNSWEKPVIPAIKWEIG